MGFEPQKFFVGLIDFFAILLPGALLTFMLRDDLAAIVPAAAGAALTESTGWALFLFSSYLLGHIIFLIGSWLLDDWYDSIRGATESQLVKRLAAGRGLPARSSRWLAARLFRSQADQALDQALRIRDHYLAPLGAAAAINTFQWCKARLTLAHPAAIASVQRFEADSKFFRSFVVVVCLLIPWGLARQQPAVALLCAPLLALALWRYVDQRFKATNQAYWYIITLESELEGGFRQHAPDEGDRPTHAGGVVYRMRQGQAEYLLVQARRSAQEWVLPKGHLEPGEQASQAAVREVREETGVWASVRGGLPPLLFLTGGEYVAAQLFLMEASAESRPSEARQHRWLALDAAAALASHPETQQALRAAEERRAALMTAPRR